VSGTAISGSSNTWLDWLWASAKDLVRDVCRTSDHDIQAIRTGWYHLCYRGEMDTVGLRELRQDASELVRRVEGGEQIDITVAGRLAARLIPAAPKQWVPWNAIAGLFIGPPDPTWEQDRDLVGQSFANPWNDE